MTCKIKQSLTFYSNYPWKLYTDKTTWVEDEHRALKILSFEYMMMMLKCVMHREISCAQYFTLGCSTSNTNCLKGLLRPKNFRSWHSCISIYQFLETDTSDRTNIGRDQLLQFLGFSLYPLSFYLSSHFNWIKKFRISFFCRLLFMFQLEMKLKNFSFFVDIRWNWEFPSLGLRVMEAGCREEELSFWSITFPSSLSRDVSRKGLVLRW